ncbi:hypothetical protein V1514DRAFT_354955 [Lipomyces japonicus]|uniref:uncharacterized protein n=1 Tax=Lipomyces japonicus TaxID=56871 RepID=UPI0034CE8E73
MRFSPIIRNIAIHAANPSQLFVSKVAATGGRTVSIPKRIKNLSDHPTLMVASYAAAMTGFFGIWFAIQKIALRDFPVRKRPLGA